MKVLFIILLIPSWAYCQFTSSQNTAIDVKISTATKPIIDKNTAQETKITAITSKNTVQDAAIASIVNRNTIQDASDVTLTNKNTSQDATTAGLATSISSLTSKFNALELRIQKLEDSITVMVKRLSTDFSSNFNGELMISSLGIERIKQAILNQQ